MSLRFKGPNLRPVLTEAIVRCIVAMFSIAAIGSGLLTDDGTSRWRMKIRG